MKEYKEYKETKDKNIFNNKKQKKINKIVAKFKLNKESLLNDQYNNCELFYKIRKLAKTKGGFINNNNRKIIWDYLFYKRKNKKGKIDLIKINKKIELFLSKYNLLSQIKELTEEKLNSLNEYQILLNDLPRTCKNIISNDSLSISNSNSIINTSNKINNISNLSNNNSNNYSVFGKKTNISPEIFMFTCEKIGYRYLQGLLNIIFYFRKIFNYENSIIALNIYFEYFYKDFLDKNLSIENNDENVALISSIISDLYNFLYLKGKSNSMEDYIPVLCNKWIISSFLSEINDINKGFRILDYLILSEPYIKYVLATVLVNKYNNTVISKLKDSLNSSFENIFNELKNQDLNFIDFDEIIDEVELIRTTKEKEIKALLYEKYGKNFIYSFNLDNHGLISYYKNLIKILEIKEPKRELKLNLKNIKYYKYFFYILVISILIYFIYDYINKNRYFW